MLLFEKEIAIPKKLNSGNTLDYVQKEISSNLASNQIPVRFVITKTDTERLHCELGLMSELEYAPVIAQSSIFQFKKRAYENCSQFNAVLLIPTGIDAKIGGHSGDGGPVAKLIASACDNLITHPNVVNAADINELPENGLYVEGSIISRLLMGTVGLQKVNANRVMLIMENHEDEYFNEATINSVSAARAAAGFDCPTIVKMDGNISMTADLSKSGRAVGKIEDLERLYKVLLDNRSDYDAVAIASLINLSNYSHLEYFSEETINPWGGVEAMLTHAVSLLFDIPSAHAPMMESKEIMNLDLGIVDPRKAAEAISLTFLYCVLKGLNKSPRIITDRALFGRDGIINAEDISCLIIPDGCVGLPTLAAMEQGIPVIAIKENTNRMQNDLLDYPFAKGKLFIVENYLEAVGIMQALKAGVVPDSVRRPLKHTEVSEYRDKATDVNSVSIDALS